MPQAPRPPSSSRRAVIAGVLLFAIVGAIGYALDAYSKHHPENRYLRDMLDRNAHCGRRGLCLDRPQRP